MADTLRALLPLVVIGLLFTLFVVLPTRARSRMAAKTRNMQNSLAVGSEVMTTSGLIGEVAGLDEDVVHLEVAPNVVVRFVRQAIAEVRTAADTAEVESEESETEGRLEDDHDTVLASNK